MKAAAFARFPIGDNALAMSQENVDILKAGFEAWNAGDMDAVLDLYVPEAIFRMPEDWPEPGPFVGREAILRQFEQLRETWDADTVEAISDFVDSGDRVVVRMIWRGSGHGPVADVELTSIYTIRKGRIIYDEKFWDHAEALEAVGLSDREWHPDSS